MAKNREGEAAPADAGTEAPPKPPEPAATQAALKRTPAAWAHHKGLLVSGAKQPWVEPHARGGHAEAANLYGWNRHAELYQPVPVGEDKFDASQVFTLTEADYDKALETARAFPAVELHEPAWPWKKEERVTPRSVAEIRKAELEAAAKAKAARKAQVS